MNKTFFSLILLVLWSLNVFSQVSPYQQVPVKSPDATAFVNVNFMGINEYTGKVDVTIPLYSINLDGLEIPISISYDSGGVKVNTTSSNVGLNWTLNAGGLISREIQGIDDISSSFVMNEEYSGTGGAYLSYGYLKHLLKYPVMDSHPKASAGIDNQPDFYNVYAPGLSTTFTHRSDGMPLEISKQNNLIYSPFTDSRFLFEPFLKINMNMSYQYSLVNFHNRDGFKFGFKIINTNGFEYYFSETEKSITLHRQRYNYQTPSEIQETPFTPALINKDNLDFQINKYSIFPLFGISTVDAFPIVKLSSIKNPISKKEVTFLYEDNTLVDNNRRIDAYSYCLDNMSSNDDKTSLYDHDINLEKLLKSIVFPEGTIYFYYDSNRLDLRGGKVLKKIEVWNNEGSFIKGVSFEQSYFSGDATCTDDFYCKRLRLDGVSFYDKNSNKIPGYSFQYNNNPLPKRYTVDQDFLGYSNGFSNIPNKDYKPQIYFKENQGKFSYLPFPFAGYSPICNGNGSKIPSLNYSKSGSLNRINYPTGGYTLFDYELNSFELFGSDIVSGGLRIKQQSIYDVDNILQKKLIYTYSKDDGLTSGKILNLPNFISNSIGGVASKILYQNYNNKLELNNSASYVGYSQVKIIEEANGFSIKKYSNSSDNPNVYPSAPTILVNSYNSSDYNNYFSKLNNGLLPSLYKDFSMKRGNLISEELFNKDNKLIKSLLYRYEYNKYGEIPISQNYTIVERGRFRLNSEVFAKFDSSIDVQSNFLKKTISTEYSISGEVINETINNYYVDQPFLKEVSKMDSNGNTTKNTFVYPFDANVSGLANVSTLNTLNILKPIKEIKYFNNEVISTGVFSYQNIGNNRIVPLNLQTSKGSGPLEIIEGYNKYDAAGNLIEYISKDGILNVILFGYNYNYKIADIIGVNHDQVLLAMGITNIDVLQTKTNSELESIFNSLRNNLSNAMITSYTHIPLIGVSTITNTKGQKTTYEYDTFNRLKWVKDQDDNILQKYCYNYKGQQVNCDEVVYKNVITAGTFKSQLCASNETALPITYTVNAGTYSSIISQNDADLKALNDVSTNGQNYANDFGVCKPPKSGVQQ